MTDPAAHRPLRMGVRCDAHAATGLGHLVRQTALIEELLSRGHEVSLFGTSDVEWGRRQAERLGLRFEDVADEALAQECADRSLNAVMIDGYDIPALVGESLREKGIGVAAMVDGPFGRHQVADLYIDQNLGSQAGDEAHTWLVGPEYVLLRDVVLERRTAGPHAVNAVPKVLVVFGGSDPLGGCPVAVELLLATGEPVDVLAIAAAQEQRELLQQMSTMRTQSVEVIGMQDDLPALAVQCDLAISAAGSSVWEFACLGLPTALVCVTDNQQDGYRAAINDVAVGLGELDALKRDGGAREAATRSLQRLLQQPSERAELRSRGRALVDGEGRCRVADELERVARR